MFHHASQPDPLDLEPVLEHDPTSDRPKIVEQPEQSIPRLPTVGLRVSF
jgi:hypothetical protein